MKITVHGKEIRVAETTNAPWWVNVENGTWEPFTYDIFDRFLTPDTTFLDIGAWIGPTVLYAAHTCKQCYAFEPDPVAYAELKKNVMTNTFQNVQIFENAILDYDGKLTLGNDSNLGDSGTRIVQAPNSFEVSCKSLKTIVAELNIDSPIFLKVDVEGCEEFIFRDLEFFRQWKPTVYVSVHDWLFSDKERAYQDIKTVGQLYANAYDTELNKIDVSTRRGTYVFANT